MSKIMTLQFLWKNNYFMSMLSAATSLDVPKVPNLAMCALLMVDT